MLKVNTFNAKYKLILQYAEERKNMKKSIIAAGAASAVLAAMPVLGVFADTMTITDTIQVTVSSSCTMATADGSSTTVAGATYTGSGAPGDLVTVATGTGVDPTSIDIQCNANNGYTLTPTFSALSNGTAAHNIAYGTGATEAAAGSKTWTAYYSLNGAAATAFGTSAISGGATMTDNYTFSYKVGLSNDQATGTYQGTAQYVLAAAS